MERGKESRFWETVGFYGPPLGYWRSRKLVVTCDIGSIRKEDFKTKVLVMV